MDSFRRTVTPTSLRLGCHLCVLIFFKNSRMVVVNPFHYQKPGESTLWFSVVTIHCLDRHSRAVLSSRRSGHFRPLKYTDILWPWELPRTWFGSSVTQCHLPTSCEIMSRNPPHFRFTRCQCKFLQESMMNIMSCHPIQKRSPEARIFKSILAEPVQALSRSW
jgi:hypothetical protein